MEVGPCTLHTSGEQVIAQYGRLLGGKAAGEIEEINKIGPGFDEPLLHRQQGGFKKMV